MNAPISPSAGGRRPKPVLLCILDGWGLGAPGPYNAIDQAPTPHWDRLMADDPHATLSTSGLDVGLPDSQMGNSEVGHMNIGAGRVVMQDLPRIDAAIADGGLARNPVLQDCIHALQSSGGRCHLMGLLSPGGVHSHQRHMIALAEILTGAGVEVLVHAFLDGRDTPPQSAAGYVREFLDRLPEGARIVTLSGRYFAMDRDNRWERVEAAYRAMAEGRGERAADALAAIAAAYEAGKTDEFVPPVVIGAYGGFSAGDHALMANFRADRAREIMRAVADPDFDIFPRPLVLPAIGMTEYSADHNRYMKALFPAERLKNTLGEVIARAGLKQLRIAETEKYAHVTFFFNGGEEAVFDGEERILVPSPKVATYDLKPEMSAGEVTDRLVAAIDEDRFDLIVVNYANPDMVGHTGVMEAALKAVAFIDRCLGRLVAAIDRAGGAMLITADHGNIEMMRDPETGAPYTAHTVNPVPIVLHGARGPVRLQGGALCDIAPTILALMGIPRPAEMTGHNLAAEAAPADEGSAIAR